MASATSLNQIGPLGWEAPSPVLLNTWKHHAAFLRVAIRQAVESSAGALDALAKEIVVIGSELMDLYTGAMTPRQIGEQVIAQLDAEKRLVLLDFRQWVKDAGGYQMIELAEDGCRWVLRLGDESDRYVHVHPGRWVPQTVRVRANVLKTAVLVLAHAGIHGGNPLDLGRVNSVRQQYLALAPLGKQPKGDQGIGEVIELLKG